MPVAGPPDALRHALSFATAELERGVNGRAAFEPVGALGPGFGSRHCAGVHGADRART